MSIPTDLLFSIVLTVIALLAVCYGILLIRGAEREKARAAEEAHERIEASKREAEARKKEALLAAKEEALRLRDKVEKENRQRRAEIERAEQRLDQREDVISRRQNELDQRERKLAQKVQECNQREQELREAVEQQKTELQRISGLTAEEAKRVLLSAIEQELRHETARLLAEIEEETKREADRKAAQIIGLAIQRCAVDQTTESTVSVVPLPGDDMKGRIIGREGRNIRAFEQLTGVDVIIDDTPEAVVISGFDPVRREIARMALESLVNDGRIHPGRIEETVGKCRKQMEQRIREAGERATFETGVSGLHPELVMLLGKLQFRTSYGQNVLNHSIEVSHLAAAMAAELKVDVQVARRAGLLHDLGKAVDFEVDGPHAQIGYEIAKARRESGAVCHAIQAHHLEPEPQSVEAVLVHAADAVSASRPGARRETLEMYIKRLEGLEQIADSFDGVEKSYAISAGREVRVIVKPDRVDDLEAMRLAKGMVQKIEEELNYPGNIKVTVIRETRAVDYAK
ncbi:MAG: ribonuclease Y [Armatimonadota bacterium]